MVGLLVTPDQSTDAEILELADMTPLEDVTALEEIVALLEITALDDVTALDEIVADGLLISTHEDPFQPRHLFDEELK